MGADTCHIARVPTGMAPSHPSGLGQPFGWHPSTRVLPGSAPRLPLIRIHTFAEYVLSHSLMSHFPCLLSSPPPREFNSPLDSPRHLLPCQAPIRCSIKTSSEGRNYCQFQAGKFCILRLIRQTCDRWDLGGTGRGSDLSKAMNRGATPGGRSPVTPTGCPPLREPHQRAETLWESLGLLPLPENCSLPILGHPGFLLPLLFPKAEEQAAQTAVELGLFSS